MIHLAKMRMLSRRFQPILIDIPEENAHYGIPNSGFRIYGHYASTGNDAADQQRDGFQIPAEHPAEVYASTGLIKSMKRRKADEGLVSVNIFSEDNQQNWALVTHQRRWMSPSSELILKLIEQTGNEDDLYHPVRMRANVIQKSPLPGRKNAQLPDSPDLNFEIYTNPSIEAIYRSLDRMGTNRKREAPLPVTSARSLKVAMEAGSDDVSDLVSEAESKLPKIETETGSASGSDSGTTVRPLSNFEADSLDRLESGSNKTSLYSKRKSRWKKAEISQRTPPGSRSQSEEPNRNWPEDYPSSTCTSTTSLRRLLPAEESMEVGNQLFNLDSGAPTLPHAGRKKHPATASGSIYDKIGPSTRSNAPEDWSMSSTSPQVHPEAARNFRFHNQFRKLPATPLSSSASSVTSSSSSHVTVLRDSVRSKPNIRLASSDTSGADEPEPFQPDTLERPEFRQPESFIDSLERPQRPKLKAPGAPVAPAVPPSLSSSSSGIESTGSIRNEELPPPGSVISLCKIYTAKTSIAPEVPKQLKRLSSGANGNVRRKAPPPPTPDRDLR